jgi:hypothetical protein
MRIRTGLGILICCCAGLAASLLRTASATPGLPHGPKPSGPGHAGGPSPARS